MQVIEKLTASEDVALITFRNTPSDMKFISSVFERIAAKGINVDMISQTAPIGGRVSLSFTVSDDDLGRLMEIFAAVRSQYPEIKYDVSGGNCKILLYGAPMRYLPGVVAKIFQLVAKAGTDVRIISTSEVDISLLIPQSEFADTCALFEKAFGVGTEMKKLK